MKNEAIKRRNEYERQGEPYTAQMILSPRKSLSAVRNDLNGLISNYISEKGLKENTAYTEVMVKTMLMFNQGEWLLPVLNGLSLETSENSRKHRISNTLGVLSPKLKEWFQKVNKDVVKRNVEDKSDIPLIDVSKCTYYTARHSFSMAYMSKGGSPMALATLLGRSSNTLAQYIKELEEEGDRLHLSTYPPHQIIIK